MWDYRTTSVMSTGIFIVHVEHISRLFLEFLLITMNREMLAGILCFVTFHWIYSKILMTADCSFVMRMSSVRFVKLNWLITAILRQCLTPSDVTLLSYLRPIFFMFYKSYLTVWKILKVHSMVWDNFRLLKVL